MNFAVKLKGDTMTNIVDFKTKAKLIAEKKAKATEEDPLKEFFADDDITDIFVSALMFLRLTSSSLVVDIKVDDDRLEIISKNLTEFEANDIDTEENYVRSASMDLTDDDGEELPAEVLVNRFQQCVEAITTTTTTEDKNNESEKTD